MSPFHRADKDLFLKVRFMTREEILNINLMNMNNRDRYDVILFNYLKQITQHE